VVLVKSSFVFGLPLLGASCPMSPARRSTSKPQRPPQLSPTCNFGRVQQGQNRDAKKIELGGAHQAVAEDKLQAGAAGLRATQDLLLAAERYAQLQEEPWTRCRPPAVSREARAPVHRTGHCLGGAGGGTPGWDPF